MLGFVTAISVVSSKSACAGCPILAFFVVVGGERTAARSHVIDSVLDGHSFGVDGFLAGHAF